MCEATVYIQRGDRREKLTEDVIHIDASGTEVTLRKLFEAPQTMEGVIREVDFLQRCVIIAVQSPEK